MNLKLVYQSKFQPHCPLRLFLLHALSKQVHNQVDLVGPLYEVLYLLKGKYFIVIVMLIIDVGYYYGKNSTLLYFVL